MFVASEPIPLAVASQNPIAPRWLRAVLERSNRTGCAAIQAVAIDRLRAKALSDFLRLRAPSAEDTGLPTTFILKLGRRDANISLARSRRWKEHEFSTRVAAMMPDSPVPRSFAGSSDPASLHVFLLLENLTPTRASPIVPLPPMPRKPERDGECLARIHAVWWTNPELTTAIAERHPVRIARRGATTQRRLDRILADVGDLHLRASRNAQDAAAAGWGTIFRRSAAMPLTVVHGNTHPWNFQSPVTPRGGATRLLDREGWSIEPGPHDLASLIALHLPVDERRALEEGLLDRSVGGLAQAGVVGYERTSAYDNYRLAVARRVLSPVGLWSRGTRARSWWPALEHITAAFHGLRWAELL
jgi:hypothetical protein